MRIRIVSAAASILLAATAARSQTAPPLPDVYDGFEAPALSDLWDTSRTVPGAVTIQSRIVRAGHSAVRIDLHARDKFGAGKDGDLDTERDEIMEAKRLISFESTPYEYSWSMYLPADFPIVPVRLVVAQWKQECVARSPFVVAGGPAAPPPPPPAAPGASHRVPCDNDSPVLAIRYIDGVLRITRALGDNKFTLWEEKRDLRGKWLDIRVQARFTPDATGRAKVWLDGKQVLDYTGILANPEAPSTGYLSPSRYYFKFGLYRDVMPQPMTAYFDEYHKKQLPPDTF